MQDIVVVQQLRKRGMNINNMEELLRYEAIEKKPRYLDKPPKRLSLARASSLNPYGCCAEFLMCYADLKKSLSSLTATVDIDGNPRPCDVEVFIALRALISQGYCCIEDRAQACFDVFACIVNSSKEAITLSGVYEAIKNYKSDNYYVKELIKALKVCLYNEKAPVLYWESQCECEGFYQLALSLGSEVIRKNCPTEKDVDKFLKPLYKQAREDKEFMKTVYKPVANKWLIPMLYYLKDSHPEALEPGSHGEEFA